MKKRKTKTFSLLFSVCYWILVAFYFVTISYFGLGKYIYSDLNYANLVGYSVGVGLSIGLLFGLFPLNRLLSFKKRRSFLQVVLISTSCYIIFFAVVIFATSLYGNSLRFALSYVLSPDGLVVLFHLSIASLFYHFILQINKKFGPGVLLEYTFGRYFAPKVEERSFMFLDLRSSTTLAEALDHVSYSRMVQDCYAELTIPLLDHKAQVYQYVGDEVVISWKMNRLFFASSCYEFFYAFQKRIEAKREHFLKQYGVYPQFKAGIHCGKVTVAEVGEIKTEIAYHGDVVNTASRIQNLCNQFQKELLVSESFLQQLPEKDHSLVSFVVDAALKGKESTTKIFTIAKPSQ
ncbi:MAG TPA: adenylate/guanylate cyclase domain-containing protein [Chitinophagaceae bacterium]